MLDLDASIYALDATTIDLCLSLFEWAPGSCQRLRDSVLTSLLSKGIGHLGLVWDDRKVAEREADSLRSGLVQALRASFAALRPYGGQGLRFG